jgi:molybdopterin converting factor small subunit
MNLRFYGTVELELDVDPGEFRGMNVPAATQALEDMLEEMHPEVDISFDDIVMAADELVTASCES